MLGKRIVCLRSMPGSREDWVEEWRVEKVNSIAPTQSSPGGALHFQGSAIGETMTRERASYGGRFHVIGFDEIAEIM